ncbi:hypothetical protein [Aromatoleum evansii]|uniref:hypothetical protein n=1 Tax=Aromatoleum evansii TaxID=59406 RepID=UPI001FE53F6F|nr:hypothetical protein [Aromatoleum evansii]
MRFPTARKIAQFPCLPGESIYACALANKLARICYACLRDGTPFGEPQPRPMKKLERTAFAVAA